jgi:hypothetical protein
MMTVNQPSARPTNKLTAATLGALLVSLMSVLVQNMAPDWHDPQVFSALGPVMVGLLGYIVKDAPNT